jgi:hypothetical protein
MIATETNLVNNPNKALWEKGDFTRIGELHWVVAAPGIVRFGAKIVG